MALKKILVIRRVGSTATIDIQKISYRMVSHYMFRKLPDSQAFRKLVDIMDALAPDIELLYEHRYPCELALLDYAFHPF